MTHPQTLVVLPIVPCFDTPREFCNTLTRGRGTKGWGPLHNNERPWAANASLLTGSFPSANICLNDKRNDSVLGEVTASRRWFRSCESVSSMWREKPVFPPRPHRAFSATARRGTTNSRARTVGYRQSGVSAERNRSQPGLPLRVHPQSDQRRFSDCFALLAYGDCMAIGAPRALRVPDDVAVVGCDDILAAEYADPPLTTVRQPCRRWGERPSGC